MLLVATPPLWLLPLGASALTCGTRLARPCLAETDKRYDKSASNSLVDQDPLWGTAGGLWVRGISRVDGDGRPIEPDFNDGSPASVRRPYGQGLRSFQNITVDGSRYYSHSIVFYPPAPQSFCELPVPEGSSNVSGSGGVCGENGFPYVAESFGTSSYEKDGTVNYFWRTGSYVGPVAGSKVYTVGDQTIYAHSSSPRSTWGETAVFTSTETMVGAAMLSFPGGENRFTLVNATKIQDEEEWIRMIEQTKIDYGITDEDWTFSLPGGDSACLSLEGCPTE